MPKERPETLSHVSFKTGTACHDGIRNMSSKGGKRAVLFTMDSITSYEENSLKGGAAGEILIRQSLEYAFQRLGVPLRIIKSDREFETISGSDYDIIIVDPWTWAAKGWVPKPPLRGQDSKVFVLDFFGAKVLEERVCLCHQNAF